MASSILVDRTGLIEIGRKPFILNSLSSFKSSLLVFKFTRNLRKKERKEKQKREEKKGKKKEDNTYDVECGVKAE